MEFRVLGPLEASHKGQSLDLGPHKQRSLLALLLIHANRVVSTDRILDELWGEDAEGKENALWVYVSRLRSVLEPDRAERGESTVLLTRDHGYMLSVDPGSVDVHRFEAAATKGQSLIRGDPVTASEVLSEALALWRGTALQDFAYDDFAQTEIARLEELRLTAVEDRIEADLRRGQAGNLVGELEALHQQHPMQERFLGHLMLALYRSGRQADALRTFERFRRHIGEELGIEPSPELRRLEEQVLLHDSRIQARRPAAKRPTGVSPGYAVNPFKGLRAFEEDDSSAFFGRDRLVADIVRRLDGGDRLIGLVGPSGSGKSSVIGAGLIPALRKGAISGSDGWLVAQMVPGSHPFAELEMALLRSSFDAPDSLTDQLADPETGIIRAALRVLPSKQSRVLLVIDQFEEMFTLVEDEDRRSRFLANLLTALDDPHGRVTVVLTLRADFYDRPLAYPAFGSRLGDGVVNVVPLMPDELEMAAQGPAERAGASFEPALVAALLTDVVSQPGALPLFQYTLTELFDRRVGDTLTLDSYRALDGVRGALTRRADDLYSELDPEQQAAARQLFLRLVTITDSGEWGRRRVHASEIVSLGVDVVALQGVIDLYTSHRLLTLDRDYVTGSPTVEVAHEALLTEWDRLRSWIEESRDDVRRHASLTTAMNEWNEAARDPGYLLTGTRLDGYEEWAATATMQLTAGERTYLDTAIEIREQDRATEEERLTFEARTIRTAGRRLWGLAATVTLLVVIGIAFVIAAFAPGPTQVAMLRSDGFTNTFEELMDTGFASAESRLNVDVQHVAGRFSDLESQARDLAASDVDLIFIDSSISGFPWVEELIADYPDTAFAVVDPFFGPPDGASSIYFPAEQGAYLAGVAAALNTKTGVVGFMSGQQLESVEVWRAGYEAGVAAVNPEIEIVATAVSTNGDGFLNVAAGRAAAEQLYQSNVDVILAAAADASLGAIEAAYDQSRDSEIKRWVIAPDSDWWLAVDDRLRPHVLTSMIKSLDVAVFQTIQAFTDGGLEPGVTVLSLSDGAMALAPSGGFLTDGQLTRISELGAKVASGTITVPRVPEGEIMPPPGIQDAQAISVTWDGTNCNYEDESTAFRETTSLKFNFVNLTSQTAALSVFQFEPREEQQLEVLAQPMKAQYGFVLLAPGSYVVNCFPAPGDFASKIAGVTLKVDDPG